jgi:hypothetical protein
MKPDDSCSTPDCCPDPSRRQFLAFTGISAAASLFPMPIFAGPFDGGTPPGLDPKHPPMESPWNVSHGLVLH